MLTLAEVLADVGAAPGFDGVNSVGLSTRGSRGQTPLHWMAYLGDVDGVRLLLEAGADPNAVDQSGNTALHDAVLSRQHLVVALLVAGGADSSVRNLEGKSPLDLALADGYRPAMEALGYAG
jgi:ankyrin repeat protein